MCTPHSQDLQFCAASYSLVPARSTLARVFGLSPQTEGFGATEGGGGPDLLLPLAVDAFEHGLLGLEGL